MEPIRVLHVLGTLNLGGAESRIMDLYRNIDRTKVQFDFLIHGNEPQHYEEEVKTLGGRVYRLPKFRIYNYFSYRKAIALFFREHKEIAVVHGHMTSTASIYLPIAKKQGISMTIAHARSAGVDNGLKGRLTLLLRRNLKNKADYCFTCSALAGEAVFGKEAMHEGRVQLIPNAIQADKYEFCSGMRDKVRKELGLEGKFVVGHVGRFSFMKNHRFLLEVFGEIVNKNENSVLLLLGEGECMDEIKALAKEKKLQDKVLFLGNKRNVHDFYQAMDYFVFPSLFEGLPGTVLEAQASSLPCLISDNITPEVMVTSLVKCLSLEKGAKEWAKVILNYDNSLEADLIKKREEIKLSSIEEIKRAGFDVKRQGEEMLSFYETSGKKKLLLVVPMLHQGGFERVCVLTAGLLKKDYQVFICVFDLTDLAYNIEGLPVFHLNLGVKGGKAGKILNVIKRSIKVAGLKKCLGIDVAYSFGPTANLVNVLSGRGKSSPNHKGQIWCGIRSYMDLDASNNRMLQLFAKGSDKIVSCSKVIEEKLRESYKCKDIVTLYNPYDKESIIRQAMAAMETSPDPAAGSNGHSYYESPIDFHNNLHHLKPEHAAGFNGYSCYESPWDFQYNAENNSLCLASMGREDDVKGFWHLIKAFSILSKELSEKGIKAGLLIIGDGSFTEYKQLARELGIEKDICFTGLKKNPYPWLQQADIYVLTSYYEGFPNALVEAMTLGIPVIATDCKTGPKEILEDKYGILIPNMSPEKNLDAGFFEEDEKRLADTILDLWQDKTKYNYYARMAKERSGHFTFEAYRQQFCKMMEGR